MLHLGETLRSSPHRQAHQADDRAFLGGVTACSVPAWQWRWTRPAIKGHL